MQETQFETDAFLNLLTDALRAGPGSPQWHEAVSRLRDGQNSPELDDYRLLVRAREDLESGREYRSVRAGAAFTRKVMQQIDDEAAGATKGIQSTTLITLLAAVGIVGVIVIIAVILLRGGDRTFTAQDLAATPFTTTIVSSDLAQGIPIEWRAFGVEPVVPNMGQGLHGGPSKSGDDDYAAGGIVSATSYAPAQSFAIEASVRMDKPTSNAILRVFVAEENVSSGTTTTTAPRELVAELNNGTVTAFKPDGSLAGEAVKVPSDRDEPIHVTIKMDGQFAVVEVDGKPVFAGAHGLAPGKPRWPGLRFLTRGPGTAADDVVVQSIRVLKP
jgi:hypothetical protein